jgi:DNA-binding response OmpR family regulator
MSDTVGAVMVVDDDPDCRDLYELWLADEYDVSTARHGTEALERLDGSIDVVVLDREMPKTRGEAVAAEIEARAVDPFVVMVSGVEPDVDILTLPVDDYLAKPIGRDDMIGAVESVANRTGYGQYRQTLLALQARKSALETRKYQAELRNSEVYRTVCDRIDTLRGKIGSLDDEAPDMQSTVDTNPAESDSKRPSRRFSQRS